MRPLSQPAPSAPTTLNSPDCRQRPATNVGREAAISEVGRKMHADEGNLKAAREEAEHQQHVGTVPESFAQCLLHRLRGGGRRISRGRAWRSERDRKRQHEENDDAEGD